MFDCEPFSRSTKASLRFVHNEQGSVSVRKVLQCFEVAAGWNNHTPGREDRFDDHRRNVIGSGDSGLDGTLETKQITFGITTVYGAVKAMWRQQPVRFGRSGAIPEPPAEYRSEALRR